MVHVHMSMVMVTPCIRQHQHDSKDELDIIIEDGWPLIFYPFCVDPPYVRLPTRNAASAAFRFRIIVSCVRMMILSYLNHYMYCMSHHHHGHHRCVHVRM